ncbi:MAG TPA: hypothetical protein VKB86_13230 [Pyrinomonadaceae bacterium]|nr:hypothetical protein [Pyrinomonadaceae bacterium]
MRRSAFILLISSLVLIGGCKESATNQQSSINQQSVTSAQTATVSPAPGQANVNASPTASVSPAAVKGSVDPCQLLTSAEVQAVQGEAVKETKASQQASGGLVSLQCYYALPTSAKSISLAVTETDTSKTGQTTAKEFWRKTFGEKAEEGREGKRDRDEKKQDKGEKREEEEQGAPPEPVKGIGDEAFWTASRFGGALYALKGDKFIRISIGGTADAETRLKKSKQLAQKALGRL